jgi:YVTN family beta-propeller protein
MRKSVTMYFSISWLMMCYSLPVFGGGNNADTSATTPTTLSLKKVIEGKLAPKSIVYSGNGQFFAQNMMYRHTVTVYDRKYQLTKIIRDGVKLSDFGYKDYTGTQRGAPVEAAFSHSGKYAWVSNYCMYGEDFTLPGCDTCYAREVYDSSFVYRINTSSYKIEKVIRVGSVPKYIAVTPNNNYVLVSNWTSGDLSVIDTKKNEEVKRIKLGRFPRGITIDSKSEKAYVCLMGSSKIAIVDLKKFSVSWLRSVGRAPRHLCLDQSDTLLYASLNYDGEVAKINLNTRIIEKTYTGRAPRSMVLSDDGKHLYVVNYFAATMSKINTRNMKVLESIKTNSNPIGITFDPVSKEIWVACYSGSIMVFKDNGYHLNYLDQIAKLDFDTYFNNLLVFVKKSLPEEVEQPVATAETVPEPKKEPIKAIPTSIPPVTSEKNTPAASTSKSYHIIIGSFKKKSNAEKLVQQYQQKGYSSQTLYNSAKNFHYVSITQHATLQNAEAEIKKVQRSEISSAWILRK